MDKLNNAAVLETLKAEFADKIYDITEPKGLLSLHIGREDVLALLGFIKEHKELQFIYLTDITAVHYPGRDKEFQVVYHVHSLIHNIRLRVKVNLTKDDLHIPSATGLWNGANWMERETYDFYGIDFQGHPDLRRILNVDDMEVFPMRKEYPLEDPNRVDKKDLYFGR